MLSQSHLYSHSKSRQQGMIALVLSVMLLVSVSLLLLGSAKTGFMEQLISRNEYRNIESNQAAQAALEYAFAWFRQYPPAWASPVPADCVALGYDQAEDLTGTIPALAMHSGDNYQLSVYYCRNSNARKLIQITAGARSDDDGTSNKLVKVYAAPTSTIFAPHFSGAPLVVDGCLSGAKGTPQANPFQAGNVVYETSQDLATASAPGSGGTTPPSTCAYDNAFKADGGLDMTTGSVKLNAFPSGDAWRYTFRISPAEFQALAADQEATIPYGSRDYYYFSNNTTGFTNFHDSLGSATQPVIIVFDNDGNAAHPACPKINGNVKIWGVIFVNGDCTGAAAAGWGGVDVYGSVVIAGVAQHLTANTNFWEWAINSALAEPRLPDERLTQLMGTWSDF